MGLIQNVKSHKQKRITIRFECHFLVLMIAKSVKRSGSRFQK